MKKPLLALLFFLLIPSTLATNSGSMIFFAVLFVGPVIAVASLLLSIFCIYKHKHSRFVTLPVYLIAALCIVYLPFVYFGALGTGYVAGDNIQGFTKLLYFEMALGLLLVIGLIILLFMTKSPRLRELRSFCIVALIPLLLFTPSFYDISSYVLPYNALDCERVPDSTLAQSRCYVEKAQVMNDPLLCAHVDDGWYRENCYYDFILHEGDANLCKEYFNTDSDVYGCYEDVMRMQDACQRVDVEITPEGKEYFCAKKYLP